MAQKNKRIRQEAKHQHLLERRPRRNSRKKQRNKNGKMKRLSDCDSRKRKRHEKLKRNA